MKAGYIRAIVIFQLVLLLWCTVLIFSRLEKQSTENSSYLANDLVNNESPGTRKSVLRGGKSLAAQDCDKVLGKKGWDFVIGCESSQCAVVHNVDHYDKQKCPSQQILNNSLRNIWNAVIHSNCFGNSFCALPLDRFKVEGARFLTYDDMTRPRNALGACLVNRGKSTTRVEWWKRTIDTIGDKKQKMGALSRISCCYVSDGDMTRNVSSSNDVGLPPNPASDIGDLWVMGSSGQIFYFPGQPGMWYNVIRDDDITYNWFLSECSKSGNHGDEQGGGKASCVTGIGLMINGYKIKISVVDPHRMSGSCKEINAPENCISGGNLEIYINDTPQIIPGNFDISGDLRFSAANLPWGCKRGNLVEQHWKQQEPKRERNWNSRELRWFQFKKSDSFRDSLIRETAHGHVLDRTACKEWLKNADNRGGGIYTMSGKLSTIEIESPTLSLLIEHHVWVGAEQQIIHRFDTYIKQYTRTGESSFGIQGATLDVKQPTTTSLKEGSCRIPDKVPIVSMIDVVGGGPANYIVGGPFKSNFPANLQDDTL